MALAAVADHRDRLPLEQREVGILVVVHLRSHRRVLSRLERSASGRARARPAPAGPLPWNRGTSLPDRRHARLGVSELGMPLDLGLRLGLGHGDRRRCRHFARSSRSPSSGRRRAPGRSGPSAQLADPVRPHLLDERLDLLLLARDLDHQQLGTHVHDPAPEDLHQGLDLAAERRRRLTLISIRSRST